MMFSQAVIVVENWQTSPPVVLQQTRFELLFYAIVTGFALLYAALTYFVTSGQSWARLIYAVLLVPATVYDSMHLADYWQFKGLLLMTIVSYICQYVAMYWFFTDPGRRWFAR